MNDWNPGTATGRSSPDRCAGAPVGGDCCATISAWVVVLWWGFHFMATTLFKDTTYSVFGLVEDIKGGEVALPDIQRPFVRPASKVRDLLDSMYKGFPVGYLPFW